jgi:8-oxo-dGTP pyrophosphatase MutT (NUDIX family)/ribosome-binding protein aMBF1 (putative translation factor)
MRHALLWVIMWPIAPGSATLMAKMAEIRQAFGNAVRFARQRRRWTQAQLAQRAGVQPRYLSEIERGQVNPSLQIQDEIATALGVPLAELIADAERERERYRGRKIEEAAGIDSPTAKQTARAPTTGPEEPIRPTLVAAIIANGDQVLMTKRRYAGEPGMWSWPAGHVDPGERPEDAVLRELSEELQISGATVVRHLGDVDYHGDVSRLWPKSGGFRNGYRMLHYLVALSSSMVGVIDHEELLEAEWLTLDQVREATRSFPPELAEAALHFAGEAIRQTERLPS